MYCWVRFYLDEKFYMLIFQHLHMHPRIIQRVAFVSYSWKATGSYYLRANKCGS